jgi:hypothetical protein
MVLETTFEFVELVGELVMGGKEFAEFDEGADDEEAGFDGLWTVQDGGGHDGAVLGEGVGELGREFEGAEVVTICDHLGFLAARQAENEVGWETIGIAFDGLVERLGGHAVEPGEVRIKDDALAAVDEDLLLDAFDGDDGGDGSFAGHKAFLLTHADEF